MEYEVEKYRDKDGIWVSRDVFRLQDEELTMSALRIYM